MHEQAHSLRENRSTIKKLIAKGVDYIEQRMWSTLPGRLPHLDGRFIPCGDANIGRLLKSVGGVNFSETDAVVWTPPGAGPVNRTAAKGSFDNLRSGYTVHSVGDRLVAFQRVIFIYSKARLMSRDPTGDFHIVPSYFVSSWSDLENRLSNTVN